MIKKIIPALLFTLLTVTAIFWLTRNSAIAPADGPARDIPFGNDKIKVFNLQSNAEIFSPLTVRGQARGFWFFEASFPVELRDGNGKLVAIEPAQASEDWMTENFVPYSVTLRFSPPPTETGVLILHRDNPSGLPEFNESIQLPIRFKKVETTDVKVFFGNSELDPNPIDCTKVFPVKRVIIKTQSVARAALEELLGGPTFTEKQGGFFTSINSGVQIQRLTIENNTARVDFNDTLEKAVGGSCRVTAIYAQITETLKQFPTVKNVIISINGRVEDVLQP